MYKNVNHDVYVNGSNDNATVGNAFLNHFNSIYYDSGEDTIAKNEYYDYLQQQVHADSNFDISRIIVKLVDQCIRKLHTGR